jgi:hypothetical protein
MRHPTLCALALLLIAVPAAGYERREIKTKDRVLGTIRPDQRTHEYLIDVPRGALLSLALPKVKGSALQGSMGIFDTTYRAQKMVLAGKRKVQLAAAPLASTRFRAIVQGVNESDGDYLLKPKLKVLTRFKIRGKRSDLSPPGSIDFGVLAGYEIQVKIGWKGPDPVTMGSFTAPDGSDVVSEVEPKQKKSGTLYRGFVAEQTGDHRIVLGIPPTAKSWTLAVKLKGKPVGVEHQLRELHARPSELTLEVASGPSPLVRIAGEEGGPNEFVLSGAHRSPALLGAFGAEVQECAIVPLEAGSAPSAYAIGCDDTHSALITVGERNEERRILDYVADPIETPGGTGTASFSGFTYESAFSARLTGWTEVRTFDVSGNEHQIVISNVLRTNSVYSYTVHHTDPDGNVRRYDFIPFD